MKVLRRTYGRGFTISAGYNSVRVYEETTVEVEPGDDPEQVEQFLHEDVDNKVIAQVEAEYRIEKIVPEKSVDDSGGNV
jgi:hypothetical protein